MLKLIIRFVLLLSIAAFVSTSDTCSRFEVKKENMNKRYTGDGFSQIVGIDHHTCAKECMSFSLCKSIDYTRHGKKCKLNKEEDSEIPLSSFETDAGAIFSDITDWPLDLVGSCRSRPCSVHQKCIPGKDTHLCQDIDTACAPIKSIKNGKLVIDGHQVGDSAYVVCDEGYLANRYRPKCQDSLEWENVFCMRAAHCARIKTVFQTVSGVHFIQYYTDEVSVYCDLETNGGGWTVFQRRFDGSVDFNRGFSEYRNGFGSVEGEHWLGLRYIEAILRGVKPFELMIVMTTVDGVEGTEYYKNVTLTVPDYTLRITPTDGDSFYGTWEESMFYSNGSKFSTFDKDNDECDNTTNCAITNQGGWWYQCCTFINLNGKYSDQSFNNQNFQGGAILKSSKMMLRILQ